MPRDVSALYRIWQESIVKMRGLPVFKREVFRLKRGHQLLPDTFAKHLGDRVRKNCLVTVLEHDANGVTVTFTEGPEKKEQALKADHAVMCVSPMVIAGSKVSPCWPLRRRLPPSANFTLARTRTASSRSLCMSVGRRSRMPSAANGMPSPSASSRKSGHTSSSPWGACTLPVLRMTISPGARTPPRVRRGG